MLLRLVRFGLGGRVGDGRQYESWIHDQDFLRAIFWLIEHDDLEGVINLAAPNPVPYCEFMRTLRAAWGNAPRLNGPLFIQVLPSASNPAATGMT